MKCPTELGITVPRECNEILLVEGRRGSNEDSHLEQLALSSYYTGYKEYSYLHAVLMYFVYLGDELR